MKLYDNAKSSVYEEIKTLYPVWYQDVKEMDALWQAYGSQLSEIRDGIKQAIDNNCIDYADTKTLARWESFFNIIYDGPRTIAERRNLLKALLLGTKHIGQKEIKDIISVFTDGQIDVRLNNGTIEIAVLRNFDDNFNLLDCYYILDNKIPAHLTLNMIDQLLPVSIFTSNRLRLHNIMCGLTVKSQFNMGYRHTRFGLVFPNHGTQLQYVDENTNERFSKDVFSGLTPRNFKVSGLSVKNTFSISENYQIYSSAQHHENVDEVALTVIGLGAKQTYSLAGSLQADGLWTLNGEYILNGSRQLNSIFEEEAI